MPSIVCTCGHSIGLGSFPNPGVFSLISEEDYVKTANTEVAEKLFFLSGTVCLCPACKRIIVRWKDRSYSFYVTESVQSQIAYWIGRIRTEKTNPGRFGLLEVQDDAFEPVFAAWKNETDPVIRARFLDILLEMPRPETAFIFIERLKCSDLLDVRSAVQALVEVDVLRYKPQIDETLKSHQALANDFALRDFIKDSIYDAKRKAST
jgi:hypothetical protein